MNRITSLQLTLVTTLLVGCASVPDVETRLKGMQLPGHTYVAQPGDTLSTVAFRYQMTPEELAAMNPHLANGLQVGERVIVHQAPVSQAPVLASAQALPQNTQIQRAQVYEGGSTINAAVPQPANGIPTADGTVAFDQIREFPANAVSAGSAPIEEVVPDDLDYTSLEIASNQVPASTGAQAVLNAPAGNPTTGWVWPTWGEVARAFAPTEAGGQGIDIAGVPGQEIHAASGGTVAYAGRDLAGSGGKLIILRHRDGLMTTYSHASQLFVAEDDVVRAGDVIASLGSNARNESVLRFEVRQDGNPLNPMKFLAN